MKHFKSRRSPYFYDGTKFDFTMLHDALEAARWAPSPFNFQPWRFLVMGRESDEFLKVTQALATRNQMWARNSSFYVIVCARKRSRIGDHVQSNSDYSQYDDMIEYSCGISAGLFLAELTKTPLQAHQMRGFSESAIRNVFGLDLSVLPLVVMAIGREVPFNQELHGHFDETLLLRSRVTRVRKPLNSISEFFE